MPWWASAINTFAGAPHATKNRKVAAGSSRRAAATSVLARSAAAVIAGRSAPPRGRLDEMRRVIPAESGGAVRSRPQRAVQAAAHRGVGGAGLRRRPRNGAWCESSARVRWGLRELRLAPPSRTPGKRTHIVRRSFRRWGGPTMTSARPERCTAPTRPIFIPSSVSSRACSCNKTGRQRHSWKRSKRKRVGGTA